ncbi:winged helix-turn-helix domain-containing protein [Terriglobus roseus]|nr:winged helix-turn-helix domain-containing protein [Terriglobus roseus]
MRGLDICDLPRKQLEILSILLEAAGEVVSRDEIIDSVWPDVIVEEHNLTQTVFLLRRALGRLPDGQDYIETVPKRGYRIALSALKPQAAFAPDLLPRISDAASYHDLYDTELPQSHGFGKWVRNLAWSGAGIIILAAALARHSGHLHLPRPYLVASRQVTRGGGPHRETDAPILVRDQTLFLTGQRLNQALVLKVPTVGGSLTSSALATGTGWVSSVHPTKDELLLSHSRVDGLIVTSNLAGEASQPFGYLHGHSAVWSPDGKRVAYGRERQLLVADAAGVTRALVEHLAGVALWLAWSPNGKYLRYTMQENGDKRSLHQVDVATGKVTTLFTGTQEEHHVCCGSWSPDGRYYVYLSEAPASSSIWVRREGWVGSILGNPTWNLADGPVDFWRSPVIAPDSHHLYSIGVQMRNHVVGLDAAFDSFLEDMSIDSMSISHDGKWVAYTTYPEGFLWKSRLDGTDRVRLSGPLVRVRSPQWSADDRSLIYLRAHDGDAWIIARMEAVLGSPERFIDEGTDIAAFSYSPAGNKIAFDRVNESLSAPAGISILSLGSRKVEPVPQSADLSNAKWSPDGRYLAAVAINRRELRIFDTQTQSWKTVDTADEVRAPAWDRKLDILYFVVDDEKKRLIRRYSVDTRAVADVMVLPDRYRHGHASKILEQSPEGRLLFGYSEGGSDVYDLTVELP